ncbi:LuxR C-terminal-related transcriptional regulator [Streptomyces xinghaiensis]|uniref:LuxR C-terminal-related transcriptional regulator n=1 Tax=Streptomyces xinghaiensis TaxID=1038928 RepID=UPI002E0ED2C2|nr:LuxR C-terminal-related transcriptional regulator [Streptomyces xinghaiensis]
MAELEHGGANAEGPRTPGATAEVRAALLRLRRASGLPVAFGGLLVDGTRLRIGELSGASTGSLAGLSVTTGNGLGGKALALSRPVTVTDYPASRTISHEYDGAVAAEGLRAVLAVPVIVGRQVRGVLYGALRQPVPLGDRTLHAAMGAARELERTLAVRDEAQRLLARGRTGTARAAGPAGAGAAGVFAGPGGAADAAGAGAGALGGPGGPGGSGLGGPGGPDGFGGPGDAGDPDGAGGVMSGAAWERVREAHARLRALAPRVADPELRDEVLAVCERLAEAGSAEPAAADRRGAPGGTGLAPRELDVLACVAAGATNADAAERLGVRPETVKAYLRSAMRRLGAHSRLEAVVAARRAGLLP